MFTRNVKTLAAGPDEVAIASACRRYFVVTRGAAPEEYEWVEAEAWFELLCTLDRSGRPLDCFSGTALAAA